MSGPQYTEPVNAFMNSERRFIGVVYAAKGSQNAIATVGYQASVTILDSSADRTQPRFEAL